MKVRNTALYISSFDLSGVEKYLLNLIVIPNVRQKPFCPKQKNLSQMISKSERTLRRCLNVLKNRNYVWWVQRGCQLSNIYYISDKLYKWITGENKQVGWLREKAKEERPETVDQVRELLKLITTLKPDSG